MNKKQFSKITSLYAEGISSTICINLILNFPAKNSQETAEAIEKFTMRLLISNLLVVQF